LLLAPPALFFDPVHQPEDTSTCELVDVGGYLDAEGINFWGVDHRLIVV
jgi:hypothetical protein